MKTVKVVIILDNANPSRYKHFFLDGVDIVHAVKEVSITKEALKIPEMTISFLCNIEIVGLMEHEDEVNQ